MANGSPLKGGETYLGLILTLDSNKRGLKMKYVVQINTDNAAFDGDNLALELVRILEELAGRIRRDTAELDLPFKIRDINGNSCGEAGFAGKERA